MRHHRFGFAASAGRPLPANRAFSSPHFGQSIPPPKTALRPLDGVHLTPDAASPIRTRYVPAFPPPEREIADVGPRRADTSGGNGHALTPPGSASKTIGGPGNSRSRVGR